MRNLAFLRMRLRPRARRCIHQLSTFCEVEVSMHHSIEVLDTIAMREDLPELGLSAGEVGAVVEVLAPDVFEVEFVDQAGQT